MEPKRWGVAMNIRQSLIEAVARSKDLLGSRVADVVSILQARQRADGGFPGKGTDSDLYYTGFALLSLIALGGDYDSDRVTHYLESFGDGEGLDLAHLAGLIRERRLVMDAPFDDALRNAFLERLKKFHCADGSFHHLHGGETGSAYGCFLAIGAYQDLDCSLPEGYTEAMLAYIDRLKGSGGGYFNEVDIPAVSVPATAAAMMVRRILTGQSDDSDAAQWLMKCLDGGGFRVMPLAPVADLLSTAVALHSLSLAGVDLMPIRQKCLCYVDLLWNGELGFCANQYDPISDTEYMFYGLLASGYLCGKSHG